MGKAMIQFSLKQLIVFVLLLSIAVGACCYRRNSLIIDKGSELPRAIPGCLVGWPCVAMKIRRGEKWKWEKVSLAAIFLNVSPILALFGVALTWWHGFSNPLTLRLSKCLSILVILVLLILITLASFRARKDMRREIIPLAAFVVGCPDIHKDEIVKNLSAVWRIDFALSDTGEICVMRFQEEIGTSYLLAYARHDRLRLLTPVVKKPIGLENPGN